MLKKFLCFLLCSFVIFVSLAVPVFAETSEASTSEASGTVSLGAVPELPHYAEQFTYQQIVYYSSGIYAGKFYLICSTPVSVGCGGINGGMPSSSNPIGQIYYFFGNSDPVAVFYLLDTSSDNPEWSVVTYDTVPDISFRNYSSSTGQGQIYWNFRSNSADLVYSNVDITYRSDGQDNIVFFQVPSPIPNSTAFVSMITALWQPVRATTEMIVPVGILVLCSVVSVILLRRAFKML